MARRSSPVLSLTCFATTFAMLLATTSAHAQQTEEAKVREYYEVRIYRIFDYDKQLQMETHLKDAYLPALKKLGIENVGVFRDMKNENDHSVFMVIPFSSPNQFADLRDNLKKDEAYQAAEVAFSKRDLKDPIYTRVESRFLKSFASMPKMELAEYSKNKTNRIFELRLYESHTDDHARRKVKMFDEGETQLMRDVKMAPVFFGETLIGPKVPNLIYMLSAKDEAAHKEHWKAFLSDPRWDKMKVLPEYKDTVSKIESWYLKPTDFSGF